MIGYKNAPLLVPLAFMFSKGNRSLESCFKGTIRLFVIPFCLYPVIHAIKPRCEVYVPFLISLPFHLMARICSPSMYSSAGKLTLMYNFPVSGSVLSL